MLRTARIFMSLCAGALILLFASLLSIGAWILWQTWLSLSCAVIALVVSWLPSRHRFVAVVTGVACLLVNDLTLPGMRAKFVSTFVHPAAFKVSWFWRNNWLVLISLLFAFFVASIKEQESSLEVREDALPTQIAR